MHFSTILSITLAFVAGQAFAAPTPQDDFSGVVTGAGKELFDNVGAACTVDGEDGTCNKFGSCIKSLGGNEIERIGSDVPECIAGGSIGIQQ